MQVQLPNSMNQSEVIIISSYEEWTHIQNCGVNLSRDSIIEIFRQVFLIFDSLDIQNYKDILIRLKNSDIEYYRLNENNFLTDSDKKILREIFFSISFSIFMKCYENELFVFSERKNMYIFPYLLENVDMMGYSLVMDKTYIGW